jgi:methylase of polypeptide subunit release factors
VHGPSLTLSHLTVRRPVETALDVGTGNGIQAILAARHSGRVVATDVNARALDFAAFHTHLNGVDNVEFRLGSFFDPAEGSASASPRPTRRT